MSFPQRQVLPSAQPEHKYCTYLVGMEQECFDLRAQSCLLGVDDLLFSSLIALTGLNPPSPIMSPGRVPRCAKTAQTTPLHIVRRSSTTSSLANFKSHQLRRQSLICNVIAFPHDLVNRARKQKGCIFYAGSSKACLFGRWLH